jgi:chemotaxis protein MotB
MASAERPIIIKRVKKVAGGHHGGAWKVAYADFVTAMMAFFLLMWLINTTSPEQKRGIADYFAPASVSASTSGSGSILGGTALGKEGAREKGASPIFDPAAPSTSPDPASIEGTNGTAQGQGAPPIEESELDKAIAAREQAEFEQAEMSLRQAMQDLPELAELSKNLIIDMTPEGLRIQIVDQEGRSMFQPGSATPNPRARLILRAVASVILQLPNRLNIGGHTDSGANANPVYSNWELSADRANAARRILSEAGVSDDRVHQVSGKAGSEPLFADDPLQAANRRISIVLLRASPPLPSRRSL